MKRKYKNTRQALNNYSNINADFYKVIHELKDEMNNAKYLIEMFDELKIMTVEEFDEMNESLDEFDGIHPYIIKGRVI